MTRRRLTRVSILLLALLQFALPAERLAVRAQPNGKVDPAMTTTRVKQSPLACNVSALNPQQRQRIRALLNEFRAVQQEIKDVPSGYAVRLPGESSIIHDAAEFITLERLCCPFFDFALQAGREGGPVWLTLTGREGAKEFARLELGVQEHTNSSAVATSQKESPLVCNDAALSRPQMERLVAVVKELRTAIRDTIELTDGYAFRLPGSATMVHDIADFIAIVRLCSPYFETTLEVECEGGPVWLKITGREGVKELVKTELRI